MTEENGAWIRSWPILLVAGLLLIGGAYVYTRESSTGAAAAALIGAGLIVLGGWFAVEVYRMDRASESPKVEEESDGQSDPG